MPSLSNKSKARYPAWQDVYEATLRESNIGKLFKLVEVAESAMLTRRDLLERSCGSRTERRAIEEGLRVLLVIKQGQLQFSCATSQQTGREGGPSVASR